MNTSAENHNYRSLIKENNFAEAAEVLRRELEINADDDKRRALAHCLFELEQGQNAITVIKQIEKPVPRDHLMLAICCWGLSRWGEMSATLKMLLKMEPTSTAYYYLAIAETQGKQDYELDDATQEIIKGYLSKAIGFDECTVKPYLWLAKLYGRNEVEKRILVLQQALEKFPQDKEVRLYLTSIYLYWKKDGHKALELLRPLLTPDYVDDMVRWYAFEVLSDLSKYEEAVRYLDEITFSDANAKAQIKADLLVCQGRLSDWLVASEAIGDDSAEEMVKKHFRKAYINLKKDNLPQTLRNFIEGSDLMFKVTEPIEHEIYLLIQDEHVQYMPFDPILDVCEHFLLLYGDSSLITDDVLGRVLFIIYQDYPYGKHHEEIKRLLPHKSESLLLTAAELMGYPPMLGKDLCCHFLSEDLPKALDYHLVFCLWADDNSVDYEAELPEYCFHKTEVNLDDELGRQFSTIHEIIFRHFQSSRDNQLEGVFIPFYSSHWRDLLFKERLFQAVVEINKRFAKATDEREGLFDLAYGLNELGQIDAAEATYQRLINKEPDNTSALNNLGAIYEKRGLLNEAQALFAKAVKLEPSEQLYASNLERVTRRIAFKERCEQQAKEAVEAIHHKASELGMTPEQQTEITELYWNSDVAIKSLQGRFNLRNIYSVVIPIGTHEKCPNCAVELVYKNRTGRDADEKICPGCGHQGRGRCRCDYCKGLEEEKRRRAEEVRRQAALEEFKQLQEKYCTTEYVEWAIAKLTRKQKQFLKAFIEVIKTSQNPTWQEVCEKAGVVSEITYLERLKSLKLLLTKPEGGIVCNSAVTLEMLDVPNVRNISKSLRFDVFQRDNHTCQYCGRTPPDVVLVIDHLIPVAQNGTDDFDNLITSCEECNAGKSDKLIRNFTGGFSKEDWREQLRERRSEILSQRRERIEEVTLHWQEILGRRYLKESDREAILTFIERYEPDWIKAAIEITIRKKIGDYIKYTAGILRNWAKDGPPDYLSNPNAGLASKRATEKQIEYVQSLLEQLDLKLEQFYHKHDFSELTMLDAQNLIRALTEKLDE